MRDNSLIREFFLSNIRRYSVMVFSKKAFRTCAFHQILRIVLFLSVQRLEIDKGWVFFLFILFFSFKICLIALSKRSGFYVSFKWQKHFEWWTISCRVISERLNSIFFFTMLSLYFGLLPRISPAASNIKKMLKYSNIV